MQEAMNFGADNKKNKLVLKLNGKSVADKNVYQKLALDNHGFTARLLPHLVHDYDGFLDESWLRVFENKENSHKELLVEFCTSFTLNDKKKGDDFNTREIITFRLAKKFHKVSMVRFGELLGLVGPDVDKEKYAEHLDASSITAPPEYNLHTFWDEVSDFIYNNANFRESNLKNPVHRMLHRFTVWTVLYHNHPEKFNKKQLNVLHYLIHRENRFHLPYAFAKLFVSNKTSGKKTPLYGGNFLTTIALNLGGILTPARLKTFDDPVLPKINRQDVMLKSYLLKQDEITGKIRPYEIGELKPDQDALTGKRKRTEN